MDKFDEKSKVLNILRVAWYNKPNLSFVELLKEAKFDFHENNAQVLEKLSDILNGDTRHVRRIPCAS